MTNYHTVARSQKIFYHKINSKIHLNFKNVRMHRYLKVTLEKAFSDAAGGAEEILSMIGSNSSSDMLAFNIIV